MKARVPAQLLLILTLCHPTHAHRPVFSDDPATDANTAVVIARPDISQVVYRELTEQSPQLWLAIDADKGFELFIQIGVPVLDRFRQFRPAILVVGPGLSETTASFELPEGSGGETFPTDAVKQPRLFHEHFTGTDSWILRSETVILPETGRYYVVAFDPAGHYGKLWLSIGKKESFGPAEWAQFPKWKKDIRLFHEVAGKGQSTRIPILSDLVDIFSSPRKPDRNTGNTIGAPIFTDPHYNGSCDPEIVWNARARQWWIFYTARRATRPSATYVGTPIGVAASDDLVTWRFRGYCTFDGLEGKADMPVTFWAPGIIRRRDTYHMFVTYKDNASPPWAGPGAIVHYRAPASDLLAGWKKVDTPHLSDADAIDASVIKVGDLYYMYYRVGNGGGIQWAVSSDLTAWTPRGKCPGDINAPEARRGFGYQEAPYVFRWAGRYWMLTDPHKGLAVYTSPDAVTWKLQGLILARPGSRKYDDTIARHPSVAVIDGRALLFYHTEPWRPYPTPPAEKRTVTQKKSFLQIAELKLDRDRLTCDRDAPITPPTPPAN